MAFGKPKTPLTPEEQIERNRRRAIGLSVAAEAFRGGDPVGRALGLRQQFEQQEAEAEREALFAELAQDPRYANQIRLIKAGLDPRMFADTKPSSLERFTLYDKNTGKPVKTILKSEAENIDRAKFIIGPLAAPFADGQVDDDLETLLFTFELPSNTEIYPKQTKLGTNSDGKPINGNFINLPYFNKKERVALMPSGEEMDFDKFITVVGLNLQTRKELKDIANNLVTKELTGGHAEFLDGPPCLQLITKDLTNGKNYLMKEIGFYTTIWSLLKRSLKIIGRTK